LVQNISTPTGLSNKTITAKLLYAEHHILEHRNQNKIFNICIERSVQQISEIWQSGGENTLLIGAGSFIIATLPHQISFAKEPFQTGLLFFCKKNP